MKASIIILLLFILLMGNAFHVNAQTDSVKIHSAKKAAIKSAIIPGWGQIYNKQYWKIPIIYAGFGTLAYFINFNQKKYSKYRNAYIIRTDNDITTIDNFDCDNKVTVTEYDTCYTTDNLLTLKDYYRRNRDLTYILTAAMYFLNIIDANVYGHLFHFDISDDLSLYAQPIILYSLNENYTGIKLSFNF